MKVMATIRTLGISSLLALVAGSALAADFLPPPPPPYEPKAKVAIGQGGYLRGDIGIGVYSSPDVRVVDQFAPPDLVFLKKELEAAPFIGIGVGYQVNNWLRFDLTGEYRAGARFDGLDRGTFQAAAFNQLTGVTETTTWAFNNAYGARISSFVALANTYIDLGTWNCLTPYLGFGVGLANLHFGSLTDTGVVGPLDTTTYAGFGPTGGGYAGSKSKTNFAWAIHAGVAYDVNPNLKLELGYRYLNLGSAESGDISSSFAGTNTRNNYLRMRNIDSHDFKLGMRWTFGPDCCAAPPPEPVLVRKY
jgi:opacity protein-like surface antigen